MLYYMNWLTYEFWTRTGGWEFDRSRGAGTSSPSHWQQDEEQAPKPVGWMMCFSSWWPLFPSRSSVFIYIYIHSSYEFCYRTFLYIFFGLSIGSCTMVKSLILGCLWPLVLVINNTLILGIWRSAISHLPGRFCPLDLLSEYWIQHGAIGPLYVTSSYSTWIFCGGVSGFVTGCPCGVWCHGLTTCLLHVGPPFGNRLLNNSWAVGFT